MRSAARLCAATVLLSAGALWAAVPYSVNRSEIRFVELSAANSFPPTAWSLGSIDGDPVDDLAVGQPSWFGDTGRVVLCLGGAPPVVRERSLEDCEVHIEGTEAGARFGTAVTVLDFDGDGDADLAVGAPGAVGSAGANGAGAVYVFAGGASGIASMPVRTDGDADWILHGGPMDGAGTVLNPAGRFDDAPGVELAVGAPSSSLGQDFDPVNPGGAGAVWVVSVDGLATASELRQGALLQLFGTESGGRFGAALAGVRDNDSDGYDDLWAAAPNRSSSSGVATAGRVVLIPGGSGSPEPIASDDPAVARTIIEGARDGGKLGWNLLPFQLDPSDPDGLDDLAVAETALTDPAVHLFRSTGLLPGTTGTEAADLTLLGPSDESFAVSMSLGLDYPVEGVRALLVGNPGGGAGGRVYVLYNGDLAVLSGGPPIAVSQASAELVQGEVDEFLGVFPGAAHGDLLGLGPGTPPVRDFVGQPPSLRILLLNGFDEDGDGCYGSSDPNPTVADTVDSDGDGNPDGCDLCVGRDSSGDRDGDGICDEIDDDADGDGCDDLTVDRNPARFSPDTDGDGLGTDCDDCIGTPNDDADADGICDSLDADDDNDGCDDLVDAAPTTPSPGDSDGDDIPDDCDLCVGDDRLQDLDNDGFCADQDDCFGPRGAPDLDRDGYCLDEDLSDGLILDCDDLNSSINPGRPDIPGNNVDEDCSGQPALDADGDGYRNEGDPIGDDCDDNDPDVHPGVTFDRCDLIDNDCDGVIDNTYDADGDGYAVGDPACDGVYPPSPDCADTSAVIYPGAPEICDGIDNDCDLLLPPNEADSDRDDFRICDGDCDDSDPDVHPGALENCGDTIDSNCDGENDGGDDQDGDGFSICDGDCDDADAGRHLEAQEVCNGVDDDCDGLADEDFDGDNDGFPSAAVPECRDVGSAVRVDCDDTNSSIRPDAIELCGDGIDNNCDGFTDEDGDEDRDGVTVCDGDCNDRNGAVYPGRAEACDGFDNNCDGRVDEDLDGDGDGFLPCRGDCRDDSFEINLEATERCNGLDDDCDGQIDEPFDLDGDGYLSGARVHGCRGELGDLPFDCNDSNAGIYPGAPELCNGVDDNCDCERASGYGEPGDSNGDGVVCGPGDEGVDDEFDRDRDGYLSSAPEHGCENAVRPRFLDCDDGNAAANPGIDSELGCSDRIDNDCDGQLDAGDEDCRRYRLPLGFFCGYRPAPGSSIGGGASLLWLTGLLLLRRRRTSRATDKRPAPPPAP